VAAPLGNQNAKKAKRWQDALVKALARFESDEHKVKAGEALDKIAERVVGFALLGDKDSIQEIGNRLDGKAAQDVNVSGEVHQTHFHHAVSEVDSRLAQLLGGDASSGVSEALPH
jgi:hypothetical protein